jgi:putative transcriptional regulator
VGRDRLGRPAGRLPARRVAARPGKPTRITNSIRALRFAHGEMTQAQLAELIRGDPPDRHRDRAESPLPRSLEKAVQIAAVFGVPLDTVFQYPNGTTPAGPR